MSTQRRVEQSQETRGSVELNEFGFFVKKEPVSHRASEGFFLDFAASRQRFPSTKLTKTQTASPDGVAEAGFAQQFRRVATGLTAMVVPGTLPAADWATYSESLGRCCHGSHIPGQESSGTLTTFIGASGAAEVRLAHSGSDLGTRAGFGCFFGQLPLNSPLLARRLDMHSASPQVPTSLRSGTERHHGQGNMYLQHAARNATCDSGRRSARRDLLRAGKRIHACGFGL